MRPPRLFVATYPSRYVLRRLKAKNGRSLGTDKALILVHGLNSSRTLEFAGKFPKFASELNQRGFSILMINLRGHGQSGASRFTFGITERRDVIAAVERLKTQGFQP